MAITAPPLTHQQSDSTGSRNLLFAENAIKSPRTATHLGFSLPFGNGSNTSINDLASPTPHTPGGIRAQLGHLLPRHAYFRTRVQIHQISSVPYLGGEFGVRWKFKGVQAPAGSKPGLLGRVKAAKSKDKGKGREEPPTIEPAPVKPPTNRADSSTSSVGLSDTTQDSSAASSTTIPTSDSAADIPAAAAGGTLARGMTPFLQLKDHSVVWEQTLDTVLKFDIDRETSQIMQNPLKLVVMQRVVPGDAYGSPQNPRLGAVYLNLAEYVGQGPVQRRYLLKESKTNATLKLTIELEYLSGETHYIPPPLAKGEILTGIAGFLENDAVKKRPRALDLYGPYKNQEELEIDLLGHPKSARPRTARSERKMSIMTETETEEEDETGYDDMTTTEDGEEEVEVAFDVQRLPVAYGTKTTEMLIESLFNPSRTSQKEEETPFTIYEPPSPGITPRVRGFSPVDKHPIDKNRTIGKRQGSMTQEEAASLYSRSSSSASVHTTSSSSKSRSKDASNHGHSESHSSTNHSPSHKHHNGVRAAPEGRVVVNHNHSNSHGSVNALQIPTGEDGPGGSNGGAGGVRGWWRRNISRPGTPTTNTRNNGQVL